MNAVITKKKPKLERAPSRTKAKKSNKKSKTKSKKKETAFDPASHPILLVVGSPPHVDRVAKSLESLAVELVPVEKVPHKLDARTRGVVVVSPLPDRFPIQRMVTELRQMKLEKATPLFAVVENKTTDRLARQLYASGATAVFHWPREKTRLPHLVAELLGVARVRGRAVPAPVALTRAVKARLRLTPLATDRVRVEARPGGEVELVGSLSELWRKRELERVAAEVPGVTRVMSSALWVQPSDLSDRQIASAVRSVLRKTMAADDSTVSVASHNGVITLAGSVADRRELRRIQDLVTNVKGVREIQNSIVVSSKAKHQDRVAAQRLRDQIVTWFPKEKIDVTVFAQVAVLSGRVASLSRRLEIATFAEQASFIERVINKIEVA